MYCLSCASNHQSEFAAEMIIHFSGLKNLDKPGVCASPRLLVCLNCGFSEFRLQGPELALLADGFAGSETATRERGLEGSWRLGC
jgi:hypothetical protein